VRLLRLRTYEVRRRREIRRNLRRRLAANAHRETGDVNLAEGLPWVRSGEMGVPLTRMANEKGCYCAREIWLEAEIIRQAQHGLGLNV
jgi:hypothetical protein